MFMPTINCFKHFLKIEIFIFFLLFETCSVHADGYPDMVRMFFKLHIEAGGKECFWQSFDNHTNINLYFDVVDYGEIDFYVLGPNGHLVQRIEKNSTGSILLQRKQFEKDFSKYGDTNKICFDNSANTFSGKFVEFYMYIFYEDLYERQQKFKSEIKNSQDYLQSALDKLLWKMNEIAESQHHIKFHQSRGDHIVEYNASRVTTLAMVQSFIIVVCGVFQVYFVKQLFGATKLRMKA